MRIRNSTVVSMTALAFVCMIAPPLLAGESHGAKYSWDIWNPETDPANGDLILAPGGHSQSQATFTPIQAGGDNSTITLTGHGTFELGDSNEVSGGGKWETVTPTISPFPPPPANPTPPIVASGAYRVTGLVRFDLAPGSLAGLPGFEDHTGNLDDTRAGLVVLKIAYDDGEKGILVFSCSIGSPQAVFEGTTATKGFVDYYNATYPDFTFGNTIFHVIHDD